MIITRYVGGLGAGTMVTAGLLFLMQGLIAIAPPARTQPEIFKIDGYLRMPKPDPLVQRPPLPDPIVKPDEPPPAPTLPTDAAGGATIPIRFSGPTFEPLGPNRGASTGGGDLLPVMTVAPVYPQTMVERGVEGFVIVEYTVAATGSVEDVIVVEATHQGFVKAAVTAAYRFRYKPRMIDGHPAPVAGIRRKLTFELED